MMIEIAVTENSAGRFYNLTTEKAAMSVSVTRYFVTVCVQNASARAWGRGAGGMGKTFHGADALTKAAASYKSSALQGDGRGRPRSRARDRWRGRRYRMRVSLNL